MVSLLELHACQDGAINWRHLLGRQAPTFGSQELRKAAQEGMAEDFVSAILDVVPARLPEFLKSG